MIKKSKNSFTVFCAVSLMALSAMVAADAMSQNSFDGYFSSKQTFEYERSSKLLEALPESHEKAKQSAWAYMRVNQYDRAIASFESLERYDYETLFGKALAYFLKGDNAKALTYFSNCLEVNKKCAAAVYLSGLIKASSGRVDDAISDFGKALKLDYNLTEARLRLAELYQSTKKYNDAYREWEKIANIAPRFKRARYNREILLTRISEKPEDLTKPFVIKTGSVISHIDDPENVSVLNVAVLTDTKNIRIWSPEGLFVYKDKSVILESSGTEVVTIDAQDTLFAGPGNVLIKPKSSTRGLILKEIEYAAGYAWAGVADREYRGSFIIRKKGNKLTVVNSINVEEYVYSVLPSEMISWWPDEALKAQSVAARSLAFFRKNSRIHKKDGYDLCAKQHCQVYKGIKQENKKVRRITDSTRGIVLKYNNRIIHTIFSSNCSGHTQSSEELKGWGRVSYFTGISDSKKGFPGSSLEFDRWIKHPPDIYCAPSKNTYHAESRWIRVLSSRDLSEWLDRKYNTGVIKKILVLKRSAAGHVNHLRVIGSKRTVNIEKENIIRSLVLGKLRSTNFIVEGFGNYPGAPEYFIFWGAGWGHAVGLCQSGAAGMAEEGFTYKDILKKYYKGAVVDNLRY